MSRIEKLLKRINNNPKNVRFEELTKVLNYKDYEVINVKGSHYSFSNNEKTITIVKPHGGKKFCYVLDVKEVIKKCIQ